MTMKISQDFHIEADNAADFKTAKDALVAQLGATPAAGGGTGTGTDPGGPATGDAGPDPSLWSDARVQAKFFPADYGMALFPSPEGSQIIVDADGTYHGPAYLMSKGGAVWKFDRDAAGKLIPKTYEYGPGFQISVNGVVVGSPTVKLVVAQGTIYATFGGGFLQIFEALDNPSSGTMNVSLPAFWQDPFYGYKLARGIGGSSSGPAGGGGGPTGGVPVPADPPAQTVAYGSTGKVIAFGPEQTFKKPSDAAATAVPGDDLKYVGPAGTVYADTFKLPEAVRVYGGGFWPADMTPVRDAVAAKDWAKVSSLYTRGARLDGATLVDNPDGTNAYAGMMGAIAYMGNGDVIGFEIMNYGLKELQHGGTAGLRPYGSCVGVIRGSDNYIHDCQNGIGPGGTKIVNNATVRTVIHSCGLNDGAGGAHCVYDTAPMTIRSEVGPDYYADGGTIAFKQPDGSLSGSAGHGYKSRAAASVNFHKPYYIAGCDASAIDISQGTAGQCHFEAGEIEQYSTPAYDTQHSLIGYAPESQVNGLAGIKADPGLRLHANCPGPNIFAFGPVDVTGCVVDGSGGKVTSAGPVQVTGLPG